MRKEERKTKGRQAGLSREAIASPSPPEEVERYCQVEQCLARAKAGLVKVFYPRWGKRNKMAMQISPRKKGGAWIRGIRRIETIK
jgi:hypothetical protein